MATYLQPRQYPLHTEFSQKNEATGTEVTVRYTEHSPGLIDQGFLRIANGPFEKTYSERFFIARASEQKIHELANRVLTLDFSALQRLPLKPYRFWTFNEETVLAALQSERPEIRAQGTNWLKGDRREEIEALHQDEEREIHKYFDGFEQWKGKPFPSEEQLKIDREFFAILEMPYGKEFQQKMNHFCATYKSEESSFSNTILRALWFENHPYHERCHTILKELKNAKLPYEELKKFCETTYGPLGCTLLAAKYSQKTPRCMFDRNLYAKTREQALVREQEDYVQQLLRETEESHLAPLPQRFSGVINAENDQTRTKVSLQYDVSPGEAIGSADIANGAMQRQYPYLSVPKGTKEEVQEIANRILKLDSSAVRSLPKSLTTSHSFDKQIVLAALQSEDPEVRVQGREWLKEERRKELALWHREHEKGINSYFQELEKWQAKPSLTEEELGSQQQVLGLLEMGIPFPEEVQEELKLDFKQVIANALWFKDHPRYNQYRVILQDIFQHRSKGERISTAALTQKHGPIAATISRLEVTWNIPQCILDRLEIPERKRTYPETREEALAIEQRDYEAQLKALEE